MPRSSEQNRHEIEQPRRHAHEAVFRPAQPFGKFHSGGIVGNRLAVQGIDEQPESDLKTGRAGKTRAQRQVAHDDGFEALRSRESAAHGPKHTARVAAPLTFRAGIDRRFGQVDRVCLAKCGRMNHR